MPTLRFSSLFALFLAFVALPLAGCDSSDDNDDVDDACTASGTVEASIDGNAFDAACIVADINSGVFFFSAIENVGQTGTSDQRQINVTIPNAGTGTFSLNPINGNIAVYAEGDITGADGFTAVSGTLQITTFSSGDVGGTFSFTGRNNAGDQVSVTSGSFSVQF